MFGFESLTLRATSLCTTQEFLLPGMDHTGQVQTWIYGSAIQGLPQLFRQGDRARESGQLCSHQGYSGCQDRVTHRSVGRAAQWGRQKNEGIRKGLWLVKSFFFLMPSQLFLPVACSRSSSSPLPQLSCTNQEMLTAGGSRLHSITQLKSNPGIFVLLPSHTWLAPTLMLLRGTQWFTNYGTNSADLPLKNFLWSQWD